MENGIIKRFESCRENIAILRANWEKKDLLKTAIKQHIEPCTLNLLRSLIHGHVEIAVISTDAKERIVNMFFRTTGDVLHMHYKRWGNLDEEFRYVVNKINDYYTIDAYKLTELGFFVYYLLFI